MAKQVHFYFYFYFKKPVKTTYTCSLKIVFYFTLFLKNYFQITIIKQCYKFFKMIFYFSKQKSAFKSYG